MSSKQAIVLLTLLLGLAPVQAKHNSDHPLTDEDWQMVMENVLLLDDAVYIPSLLPVVMQNRDALALSEAQLQAMYKWRREHYVPMVNLMNEIIEMKIRFKIEALSSDIDQAHLIAFQQRIHQRQQALLRLRLSCREILISSFTPEQWENLEFVVADNPKLAGFISQVRRPTPPHDH